MMTQVVVIGGGYAGVMAANRLGGRRDIAVTLVNPRDRFVDRIRLHQQAVGTHEASLDYATLLGGHVRRIAGTAATIQPGARTVALEDGREITYDYLVYAVGSAGAAPRIPGADHVLGVSTWEESQRLRTVLAQTPVTAPVVVVGGGPTGIEMAGELADAGRTVTLVCGARLGPYLHETGRRRVRRELESLGVTVLDGATVAAAGPDGVVLADGSHVPSSVTVWTAGFTVPDLAARSGLSVDPLGRLLTDETLTSVDDDRIMAAGDAVTPSGQPMRMSCQAAMPLGSQAARTILSRIDGETPRPIDSGFVGQCLSVGRRLGLFQYADSDDRARGLAIPGRAGGLIKETVAAAIPPALAKEGRHPGAFRWPSSRARAQLRDRTPSAITTSAP